jgi:hypothetical protein
LGNGLKCVEQFNQGGKVGENSVVVEIGAHCFQTIQNLKAGAFCVVNGMNKGVDRKCW